MQSCPRILVLLISLLLTACGVAVPPDKSDYVGEWNADGMSLLITQDGSVVYQRIKKGAKTSIDAPLKGFKGDDFEVGLGPMVTTFKVTSPPHKVGDQWMMTVDGVELTRR